MGMVDKRIVLSILLSVEIVLSLISAISKSIIGVIVTGLCALILLVLYLGWDIIDTLIFKHTGIVLVFGNYELGNDRLVATSNANGNYYSISVSEVFDISKCSIDPKRFERMIEKTNIPFKIAIHVERLKTNRLVEKLETKKYTKEIALSRVVGRSSKAELKKQHIKNEISYLDHEISELKSGGIPVVTRYYIMCAGNSSDRYSSERIALSNMNQVSSEFDSSFCVKSRIVSGASLIEFLKLEYMIL
ncbi:MAG: hypothetical protein M1562_02045 [Candidatus Marsarchaeota archaeon]|jgi:hypothetical protein|nr:hypothetical protein [Candidatus Marsarchaeota archaeon]